MTFHLQRKNIEGPASLSQEDWHKLQLLRSENVGPVTYAALLRTHGSAKEALAHIHTHAARGGLRRPLSLAAPKTIDDEIAKTFAFGAGFLFKEDAAYSPHLAAIYDPPPILIYKGDVSLMSRTCVGCVGARNASLNAKKFTRTLAQDLGKGGAVVVSGLARGIDTAAHEGALETGTIACVAGGIDTIYPPENKDLFAQIMDTGLVITETPFGVEPQGALFPRRNRLISGLSLGVIVVEAAFKSGSLITARLALEQGREVFAVPGFPMDPRAQGTNTLIQNGAALLQKASDVLEALQNRAFHQAQAPASDDLTLGENAQLSEAELARLRDEVMSLLSPTPIYIDELRRECHISNATLSLILLELELAGRVSRLSADQVCVRLDGASVPSY